MTICKSFCALVMAAVVSAAFANISSAQQSPAPSAASLLIAKEIIDLKGATTTFDPIITGVVEYHKNLLIQTNPNLSKPIDEVAAKLLNELQGRKAELQQMLARNYAERFNEKELREALAFYRSPLGKKLVAEEPKALEETMKSADAWSRKLADEVVEKLRAELKKRGLNAI